MPNNTIETLREHLFETLTALRRKDSPMEVDRAKAIADVGRVLVDSAKVEVDFLKTTGALKSTGFLPDGDEETPRVGPRALTAGAGR